MRRWVSFDGDRYRRFWVVLCGIDSCVCDVEMEFEVWQQSGRDFILAVVCDPSEATILA